MHMAAEESSKTRKRTSSTNCGFCNTPRCHRRCSRCRNIYYCDRTCQANHWQIHKAICKKKTQKPKQFNSSTDEKTNAHTNAHTNANINATNTNIIPNSNLISNLQENDVYTNEDAIKKYGQTHGKIIDGILHFAGYKIAPQTMLDVMINNGKAYSQRFKSLSIEDQAKVMLGTKKIYISEKEKENEIIEQYSGSNGRECNGCGLNKKRICI